MSDSIDRLRIADEVKKDALRRFEAKMKEWGIAMPPAQPLVMDFGLEDFNKVGLIEYWIANEVDAGYSVNTSSYLTDSSLLFTVTTINMKLFLLSKVKYE